MYKFKQFLGIGLLGLTLVLTWSTQASGFGSMGGFSGSWDAGGTFGTTELRVPLMEGETRLATSGIVLFEAHLRGAGKITGFGGNLAQTFTLVDLEFDGRLLCSNPAGGCRKQSFALTKKCISGQNWPGLLPGVVAFGDASTFGVVSGQGKVITELLDLEVTIFGHQAPECTKKNWLPFTADIDNMRVINVRGYECVGNDTNGSGVIGDSIPFDATNECVGDPISNSTCIILFDSNDDPEFMRDNPDVDGDGNLDCPANLDEAELQESTILAAAPPGTDPNILAGSPDWTCILDESSFELVCKPEISLTLDETHLTRSTLEVVTPVGKVFELIKKGDDLSDEPTDGRHKEIGFKVSNVSADKRILTAFDTPFKINAISEETTVTVTAREGFDRLVTTTVIFSTDAFGDLNTMTCVVAGCFVDSPKSNPAMVIAFGSKNDDYYLINKSLTTEDSVVVTAPLFVDPGTFPVDIQFLK